MTHDAPPDAPIELAPYALLRVPCLAYERLAELTPPALVTLGADVVAAERAMEAMRPAVEDDLHAAVPRAGDDRKLRGALIGLKRDVHGGRDPGLRDATRTPIAALLGPDASGRLGAWLAARARLTACLDGAEPALAAGVREHLRPGLHALLDDGDFVRALALGSPELYRTLARERARPPAAAASSKAERSLLAYVVRAATKTNPFGTFMHLGVVDVGGVGASAPRLDGVARTVWRHLSRTTTDALHRAAIARAGDALPLRVSPSLIVRGQGRVEAIVHDLGNADGRAWRRLRRATFRLHARVIDALVGSRDGTTRGALIARLVDDGVDAGKVPALIDQLIAAGILIAPAIVDAFTARPEDGLEGHGAITAALDAMDTPGALIEACERLRAVERAASPSCEPSRNVVSERSAYTQPCGAIGAPMAALLAEVGALVRPRVVLDPSYMLLRRRFVEAFGAGGRCDDVLGFLLRESERPPEPWTPPGPRDRLDVPDRLDPIERPAPGTAGVTVSVQIAAADADAAAAGDAVVVLGRAYTGLGWITARHAVGPTEAHAAMRAHMRRWIARAYAPAEPVDYVLWGDLNDVQAHPRLTERVIAWPGEPLLDEHEHQRGPIAASELRLHHDADRDRLILRDAAGRHIAPACLGATLLTAMAGLPFLMWKLACPHVVVPDDDTEPAEPCGPVEHRDRVTVGRVVVRREAWWVRASHLRALLAAKGAGRIVAMARALDAHGVPRRFFAHPHLDRDALLAALRAGHAPHKPMWIDAANPFCLDVLERMLDDRAWIVLTEVLPDQRGMWATAGGAGYAAELHVEMIL